MVNPDTQSQADLPVSTANGVARQTPLSSTSTLFWRLFVPVFSTVILSGFLLAFWLIPAEDLYLSVPIRWVRLGISAGWLTWVAFMYRTLWRLHRVDADINHVFVTNYWVTVRYPWSDITQCTQSRHLGRRIAHLHLRAPGRFGQKISFLPASHFDTWMADNNKPAHGK